MKPRSLTNNCIRIKYAIFSALLMFAPTISYASLIYQIDVEQSFDTDSTAISGYVVWDETLLTITDWHFETIPGFGVHDISTEGAIFDASGLNDTMAGDETSQTYYTITSTASQELEIIWDTSPENAFASNSLTIMETWFLNDYPGTHWRTGTVSVSLVSTVPLPASIWLFASGLLGFTGLAKHKYYLLRKKA